MAVKISDLLPAKVKVDTGNGMLEVSSINLKGITTLIQNFKEPLIQLFTSGQGGGTPDFLGIATHAPDMIVAIIAMGADAEGQEEDIAKLGLSTQILAAAEIWALSVPEPKKLLSVLSTVLAQITPPPNPSPAPAVVAGTKAP